MAGAAGPMVPGTARAPCRTSQSYDALIFFTYLYAPTVLGLQIDPSAAFSSRPHTTNRRFISEFTRRCFSGPKRSPSTRRSKRRSSRRHSTSAPSPRKRSGAASIFSLAMHHVTRGSRERPSRRAVPPVRRPHRPGQGLRPVARLFRAHTRNRADPPRLC